MEDMYWISIDIGKWIKMPDYSSAVESCLLFSEGWGIPHYLHYVNIQGKAVTFKYVNGKYTGTR